MVQELLEQSLNINQFSMIKLFIETTSSNMKHKNTATILVTDYIVLFGTIEITIVIKFTFSKREFYNIFSIACIFLYKQPNKTFVVITSPGTIFQGVKA